MHFTDEAIGRQPQFDPIQVQGSLRISLFGLNLGRIRLSLNITSLDRFTQIVSSAVRAREDDDMSTLSRAELYELARSAQISGRSKMSRADLVAALEHHR